MIVRSGVEYHSNILLGSHHKYSVKTISYRVHPQSQKKRSDGRSRHRPISHLQSVLQLNRAEWIRCAATEAITNAICSNFPHRFATEAITLAISSKFPHRFAKIRFCIRKYFLLLSQANFCSFLSRLPVAQHQGKCPAFPFLVVAYSSAHRIRIRNHHECLDQQPI